MTVHEMMVDKMVVHEMTLYEMMVDKMTVD